MISKKISILFIYVFLMFVSKANDTLEINSVVTNAIYPNKFTGISSMTMYEHIDTIYNPNTHTFTSKIFDTIYNLIKPLNLKVFRFPGGTIGNYYHFYGKGHGIDTSETTCATGRIGEAAFANQHLGFDQKADRNIIEFFKEEIDTLKKYGDNIGVCYRINSHTHFYKGDLKKHTDSIQYLISKYFTTDTAFLSTNGNTLDSTKINTMVSKLLTIQSDPIYIRIKKKLISDSAFYYRFKENTDAVSYLKNNRINILGAEIGNETYAEYVVFDDDLNYLGYDCTNVPPNFHYDLWQLPVRYYIEGMLKNNLLVSLYADTLKSRFNIYSAVPANNGFNYLTLDNQYNPVHIKPYDLTVKKSDLWNKYFASQNNVSALIPHIYSQEFMSCSTYMNADSTYNLPFSEINKIATRFYKYYIDTLLVYNLKRFNFYANNKPLWITEWNFSEGSFANNTFLHAFYDYYFIRKMVDIHDFSTNYVQILLYHHLSGGSHTWPIIRTRITGHQFNTQKQITYSPFYIWSNTINKHVKRLKTPFWNTNPNTIIDAFIDSSKQNIIIQYANMDTNTHFIDLKNLIIKNNLLSKEFSIDKIDYYQLDAASILSTNYTTCSFFTEPNYATSYQILEDTLASTDTLFLPGISMGKFTLHLKNKVNTAIPKSSKKNGFSLYPNPSQNTLIVQLQNQNMVFPLTYTIYDSLGKLILSDAITELQSTIDISSIAQGWYQLQLTKNGQHLDTKSFIKM